MSVMTVATVGIHVLDTHVVGVEEIPQGSDGALVPSITVSPAGTAAGAAVVFSRLGAQVRTVGAIGADAIGMNLRALLDAERIDTGGLVVKSGVQTSASVIPVRPNGDRPAWHCVGANAVFTPADIPPAAWDGLTHLHLGGPEFLGGPAAGDLLERARARGIVTSMDFLAAGDPGTLEWVSEALPHTDYLLPNDEQVRGFTGRDDLVDGARALLDKGVGCVAFTRGGAGAVAVTADEVSAVPAYAVDVVDTTGCGDSFSAGFLTGRFLGEDLAGSLRLGCAVAAHVASGVGTTAGNYDLARVRQFAASAATVA
ncbi:PfkB family carbohydrate kinase [Arthrobacter sp. SLBN-53]|uniref:carbohydrate kinase family protein n=1 Tax=Arthrobacter sp. SLBN-53 TaxID=2768412 RepID=UPI00116F1D3D|nr:PfkB family carbohydrate kinase [Arthrobacter sp. SLBN-53]TQK29905.1 sugar/nucleoside kinase (ribokinase family) [Arthrobacter sp. SLBN-53]